MDQYSGCCVACLYPQQCCVCAYIHHPSEQPVDPFFATPPDQLESQIWDLEHGFSPLEVDAYRLPLNIRYEDAHTAGINASLEYQTLYPTLYPTHQDFLLDNFGNVYATTEVTNLASTTHCHTAAIEFNSNEFHTESSVLEPNSAGKYQAIHYQQPNTDQVYFWPTDAEGFSNDFQTTYSTLDHIASHGQTWPQYQDIQPRDDATEENNTEAEDLSHQETSNTQQLPKPKKRNLKRVAQLNNSSTDDARALSIPPCPTQNLVFPTPAATLGFNTSSPKWGLDQYILTLRLVIKQALKATRLCSDERQSIISDGVFWAVREAWPEAEGFWKFTASFRGFVQSEIWRNFPSHATYSDLHGAYRPTALQLSIPHSPIIDWMPWPELRDRIILVQDQVDVDHVCRALIQNVVSHRRLRPTKSITGDDDPESSDLNQPSFRTWDLQLLEKQSGFSPTGNEVAYRPRSVGVVALEKAYGLVFDDFLTQKLHSSFFDEFPFLMCESAASRFKVQEIPLVVPQDLGYPKPLTSDSVDKLKSLVEKKIGQRIILI
ncbi:hypothetical protein BGW36DRAFT_433142 [Talaromyces proteolyticus]|uniref:Uncharacterized protein n=1 Tax=Talaromyces proteolyticus TaxID=1131652 RepID=A0AAD4PS11_9EURO|nr:uncharacterized protein BGW36DRAFT_433142 [Talaromyces proteolyticus]KAH8690190.1 hypothetical protein BGW36DRAFT_433142 [Talaromyces proteolyticus]